MPIEWEEEAEDFEGAGTPLSAASNIANEINYGILQPFGLQGLAEEIGIGVNRPTGENGQPSPWQSGMRLTGNAIGTGTVLAAPYMRAAGAPDAVIQATNAARQGVGKPSVGKFVEEIADTMMRKPGATAASEGAAAFGAGVAGQNVYDSTGSETGRAVGEIVGGIVSGSIPSAAQGFARLSPSVSVGRQIYRGLRGKALDKTTQKQAAERVKGVAEDPLIARAKAGSADVLPGTSYAARSEDQGLLALEKAVYDSTEQLSDAYQRQFAKQNARLREEFAKLELAPGSIDESRAYLQAVIDQRLELSKLKIAEKLSGMDPATAREQANILARQELDSAYKSARATEGQLWNEVDENAYGAIDNTRSAYIEIINKIQENRTLSETMGKDLNLELRNMLGFPSKDGTSYTLGALKGDVTVGELKALRTKLLEDIRAERAKDSPNRRRIGINQDVADAILSDMEAMSPGDEALAKARAFSADLNAKFTQGQVGNVLGFERTGGESVGDLLTLERTVGRPGMSGAEAVDQFLEAAPSPEMRLYMEDFLADEFLRASKRSGEFSPASAQNYLNRRQDVLKRFPELRRKMQATVVAGEDYSLAATKRDKNYAYASTILKANVGDEVNKMIRSSNPSDYAKQTMRLLSRDSTGNAVAGVRKAMADYLLDKSSTGSVTVTGEPIISGPRLNNLMNDRGFSQVANQVFSKDQLKRLDTFRNTAMALHRQQTAKASGDVVEATETMFSRVARRIAGAQIGRWIAAKTGGGTVQTPGIVANALDSFAAKGLDPARMVIIDAITSQDDTLMRALLSDPLTPKARNAQNRRLNAWFLSAAREHGIKIVGEEEESSSPASSAQGGIIWNEEP